MTRISNGRSNRLGAVAVGLAGVLAAGTALAASVHLKGGKNAEPAFEDLDIQLNAMGEVGGLGNGDVLISISATAIPTATCTNPGNGDHQPPGQNPALVDVTGSQFIPTDELGKNGFTPFDVTTDPPVTPIVGAPDCPNPSWSEDITDMAFTSATITVEQGGIVVLTVACTFSQPTSDGEVPGANVSCVQS